MINVPSSFTKWARLFGKCSRDYVLSFSFSAFIDELHGKGREKCISNGGCIIIDNYNDGNDGDDDENEYSDGDRKRRATSIEHCLHSIEQIGSAPLLVSRFHAWTRKCGYSHRYIISAAIEKHERKGDGAIDAARSTFSALVAQQQQYQRKFHFAERAKDSKAWA